VANPTSTKISPAGDRDALLVSIVLPFTTFSILCYEIVLTRLFAYIFDYHLTALAVSFAVFGLGSGAYIRVRWLSRLPQTMLATVAHLGSSASLFALYVALMLTHSAGPIVIVSAIPFVFAGIAVSHYYEARRADRAAATYALDLSGAAVGCVASVFLLARFGGSGTLLLLAALAGGVAVVASMRAEPTRRGPWVLLAALCAILPVATHVFQAQLPDPLLNRHSSLDKPLPRTLLEQGGRVADTAWSAVGRADLYQPQQNADWSIYSDATNNTVFPSAVPAGLQELFPSLPYAIAPVRGALILGSGGGLEVRIARDAGVADVEAVELNDAIIRLVRRWRGFGGPIYDQPGVTLFVEEGRKFVLTTQRRYDLIQMSLVLTATAQSGTYALAEGYLYTEEAFRSYLDHLEPTGAIAMIDESFERTLKNTVTAVTVFEHTLGLRSDEAMKRIAVIFNPRRREPGYKYLLLVSPTPLSDERIRRLGTEIPQRTLDALWLPGVAATPQLQALAERGADAFVRAAAINLTPPTDDKPYLNFFAKTPEDVLRVLRPYLVLSLLMATALVAMFVTDGMSAGVAGRRSTALAGLYGVGFMFLELGLLHKLALAVGGPAYVLSVLLFALLLACGLGSLASGRFASVLRSKLGSFGIVVAVVGVLTAEVIERCYRLEGVSSSLLRVAAVLAIVTPIGICLGAPFPDLLRRYGRPDEHRLAYLWAVNGVGSVLGGGLTLILLPTLGGHLVLLAGSMLYLCAWAIDRKDIAHTNKISYPAL
jgi:MFS family permease